MENKLPPLPNAAPNIPALRYTFVSLPKGVDEFASIWVALSTHSVNKNFMWKPQAEIEFDPLFDNATTSNHYSSESVSSEYLYGTHPTVQSATSSENTSKRICESLCHHYDYQYEALLRSQSTKLVVPIVAFTERSVTLIPRNNEPVYVHWLTSLFNLVAELKHFLPKGDFLWELIHPQTSAGWPFYNPAGMYCVRLYYCGQWRAVEVQDLVPCNIYLETLTPKTPNPEVLWPMILTIALWKVFQNEIINGIEELPIFEALTSWKSFRSALSWNNIQNACKTCMITSIDLPASPHLVKPQKEDAVSILTEEKNNSIRDAIRTTESSSKTSIGWLRCVICESNEKQRKVRLKCGHVHIQNHAFEGAVPSHSLTDSKIESEVEGKNTLTKQRITKHPESQTFIIHPSLYKSYSDSSMDSCSSYSSTETYKSLWREQAIEESYALEVNTTYTGFESPFNTERQEDTLPSQSHYSGTHDEVATERMEISESSPMESTAQFKTLDREQENATQVAPYQQQLKLKPYSNLCHTYDTVQTYEDGFWVFWETLLELTTQNSFWVHISSSDTTAFAKLDPIADMQNEGSGNRSLKTYHAITVLTLNSPILSSIPTGVTSTEDIATSSGQTNELATNSSDSNKANFQSYRECHDADDLIPVLFELNYKSEPASLTGGESAKIMKDIKGREFDSTSWLETIKKAHKRLSEAQYFSKEDQDEDIANQNIMFPEAADEKIPKASCVVEFLEDIFPELISDGSQQSSSKAAKRTSRQRLLEAFIPKQSYGQIESFPQRLSLNGVPLDATIGLFHPTTTPLLITIQSYKCNPHLVISSLNDNIVSDVKFVLLNQRSNCKKTAPDVPLKTGTVVSAEDSLRFFAKPYYSCDTFAIEDYITNYSMLETGTVNFTPYDRAISHSPLRWIKFIINIELEWQHPTTRCTCSGLASKSSAALHLFIVPSFYPPCVNGNARVLLMNLCSSKLAENRCEKLHVVNDGNDLEKSGSKRYNIEEAYEALHENLSYDQFVTLKLNYPNRLPLCPLHANKKSTAKSVPQLCYSYLFVMEYKSEAISKCSVNLTAGVQNPNLAKHSKPTVREKQSKHTQVRFQPAVMFSEEELRRKVQLRMEKFSQDIYYTQSGNTTTNVYNCIFRKKISTSGLMPTFGTIHVTTENLQETNFRVRLIRHYQEIHTLPSKNESKTPKLAKKMADTRASHHSLPITSIVTTETIEAEVNGIGFVTIPHVCLHPKNAYTLEAVALSQLQSNGSNPIPCEPSLSPQNYEREDEEAEVSEFLESGVNGLQIHCPSAAPLYSLEGGIWHLHIYSTSTIETTPSLPIGITAKYASSQSKLPEKRGQHYRESFLAELRSSALLEINEVSALPVWEHLAALKEKILWRMHLQPHEVYPLLFRQNFTNAQEPSAVESAELSMDEFIESPLLRETLGLDPTLLESLFECFLDTRDTSVASISAFSHMLQASDASNIPSENASNYPTLKDSLPIDKSNLNQIRLSYLNKPPAAATHHNSRIKKFLARHSFRPKFQSIYYRS